MERKLPGLFALGLKCVSYPLARLVYPMRTGLSPIRKVAPNTVAPYAFLAYVSMIFQGDFFIVCNLNQERESLTTLYIFAEDNLLKNHIF